MKNQLEPKIFMFIALDCEAKPLIKYFNLKKQAATHAFSVYKNEQYVLTVTGVGKVAVAGAVAYTLALFPNVHLPVLMNLGIAGHKSYAIGNLYLASKIVDGDTGKKNYPQLVAGNFPETSENKTVSIAVSEYEANCLYDMEASAFYEMAVRFSSAELIQCLKIISDNELSSVDNINAKFVTGWVQNQLIEINQVIVSLLNLRECVAQREWGEFHHIVKKWHFTVTGEIRLKALLMRWKVLAEETWTGFEKEDFNSAKELLIKLEQDVEALRVEL